ncbi:ATP-binding protein [Primorskyibacter sp. S87]|uniref:PAS domain-containing hybrid sensor histidine kinase/response regulator n=1 Tax=Primorskyibacter sp. S87 TaxID=3415126 RepID=UPI003C7C76B2
MRHATPASFDALSEYGRQFSRRGLLLRYARGRIAHFHNRLLVTLIGSAVLWLANGPEYGIGALLIALGGEVLDCAYLRGVEGRIRAGQPLRRVRAVSTLTGGLQGASIAICTGLSWFGPATGQSPLFTFGFLAGAAVNAAIVLPFHKQAAALRLGLYAATPVLLLAIRAGGVGVDARFFLDATGVFMLVAMVVLFLAYVLSGFSKVRRQTLSLTEFGRALEASNRKLRLHQKEAQKLSMIARNANDSVILSGREGQIIWVNDAFTRMTGFELSEAIGQTPAELLNCEETNVQTIAAISAAVRDGRAYRGEILNRTRDGRRIWVETNLSPVFDEDGQVEVVVSVERDVTAAKNYEAELAQARLAAEEGARTKAEFLATMSHEIRTPMNGVIGMTDLLAETELTPDQLKYTKTIRNSAQALLTIINHILEMSKLDAGKLELDPVEFDLTSCIEDTVLLLGSQAASKGVELQMKLASDLPEKIRGDDGRIRQVLLNLIGNAIKFTEQGYVTIRVSVVEESTNCLLGIDVEDTGIGIAPDKIETIFERFAQADAATTRRFGGTGLGLTISRMLVEAMGGRIDVTSNLGVGSCFSVAIPIEAIMEPEVGCLSAVPIDQWEVGALKGRRVLVAEDNRTNRLLIRKFLEDLPLKLSFAEDGIQAVEQILKLKPDLVFMDMSMPHLSGLDVIRQIRATDLVQPKIIALTANAFDSDRRACSLAGMDGFLTKPVRRTQLLGCMFAHLSHSPPAD